MSRSTAFDLLAIACMLAYCAGVPLLVLWMGTSR